MAGIGGFLGGLGLAAGRNIIVGQEMANTQSEIDLRKADIAEKQQRMAAIAQQQQTAKAVGDYISTEAQKDSSVVTDPIKSAKLYENATAFALRAGDFASANTMSQLAKEKLNEAKEAAQVQAQQMQLKKEDLANEADSFATNPTQEGANRLVQKAVDAGVNPQSIPKNPNSPEFRAWAGQQQLASKTASQRADFIEKTKEAQEKAQEKKEEFAQREQDRHVQMQQTALLRESAAEDRKARLSMEQERLDYEKERDKGRAEAKANAPTKTSVQTQRDDKAIVASSREALRGLRIVGAMDSDQTSGPFAGLHDGTILESISKTGTNMLTPEDMQIYKTATAGLGLEVARAMTLGGGRGANQSVINEMQDIITAHPGDSKGTAIFKYANAVDIIRNRLESMGTPSDPQQAKLRDDTLKELDKIPTPAQVLKSTKDPKQRKAMLAAQGSMEDVAGKIQEQTTESPVPSAAPAGASAPGLPSGWSVKEH